MLKGVMKGNSILKYIPLNRSTYDRHLKLFSWIQKWLDEDSWLLSPEEWFEKGYDFCGSTKSPGGLCWPEIKNGKFIWAPPPAAADVAVEQLRVARLKRADSTHVFVCPKLLSPLWCRQLYKAADVVIEYNAGKEFWPTCMHEPLILAICFPFISCRPWQLRQTPAILGVGRMLQRLWKTEEGDQWSLLQKFCLTTWNLESLSASLVWGVLQGSG